jgi:hypothetical protein
MYRLRGIRGPSFELKQDRETLITNCSQKKINPLFNAKMGGFVSFWDGQSLFRMV